MTDANTHARLRLALIPGLGPMTQHWLVRTFGSAQAAFERVREIERLQPAVATALMKGPDPVLLERSLRWQEGQGHKLIAFEDEDYPELLRQAHGAPSLLYACGNVELLRKTCVAIVGARNATPQGSRDAQAMARALSEAGITIVSGLALGIDAAAHRGGLAGAGSSVAVTGTGIDLRYPPRNRDLAEKIEVEGCVVTEFALGTPPFSGNFPRRNRIISGLSRAVLVVEANENSGSLLTAYSALSQGRDVLAMPGSVHSPLAKGCHKLIKEGAGLVETADDVLDALGMPRSAHERFAGNRPRESVDPVLRKMGFDPLSQDEIALRAGIGTDSVGAWLSRMQIAGKIEEVAAGRFQRVERPS
jgi:DNA processing protein